MNFDMLHRGIANSGCFERMMVSISANRPTELLPLEPVLEVIR